MMLHYLQLLSLDCADQQIGSGWNTLKGWGLEAAAAVGSAFQSGPNAISPFS